jgi:hypothetical protein
MKKTNEANAGFTKDAALAVLRLSGLGLAFDRILRKRG